MDLKDGFHSKLEKGLLNAYEILKKQYSNLHYGAEHGCFVKDEEALNLSYRKDFKEVIDKVQKDYLQLLKKKEIKLGEAVIVRDTILFMEKSSEHIHSVLENMCGR